MKPLAVLSPLFLLAGLGLADPELGFPIVPDVYADEQHAEHTQVEAAEEQDDLAGQHTHTEDNHSEHKGMEHQEHDLAAEDHGHEAHDHESHDNDQHTQDEHDHQKEHAGHEHGEEQIRLTPAVMREFGIEIQVAESGQIAHTLRLPGEIVYNADRIAHVGPMVTGSVLKVNVSVGDRVEAGQVMAVLTSRELASARSDYLAAVARLELAQENHARNKQLLSEKVGTKQAADVSRKAYREAVIERKQAVNELYALGFTRQQVKQISTLDETAFSAYEIVAPLSGIVTQRHITIGEIIELDEDEAPFVVADLSSVWVNLTVYQRDLPRVRAGQSVTISFDGDIPDARGTIAFLSPALDEATRTANARVVLEDPHPDWRPGIFVSGNVEVERNQAAVVVPHTALTQMDGKTVLFIQTEDGFEPREVQTGRMTPHVVEILKGLAIGERYASNNVLALKAESNRAALEHAGHVH